MQKISPGNRILPRRGRKLPDATMGSRKAIRESVSEVTQKIFIENRLISEERTLRGRQPIASPRVLILADKLDKL